MAALIAILVAVIIVAVVLWAITLIPMDARLRQVAQAICAIILVVWLFGVLFGYVPLPHIR